MTVMIMLVTSAVPTYLHASRPQHPADQRSGLRRLCARCSVERCWLQLPCNALVRRIAANAGALIFGPCASILYLHTWTAPSFPRLEVASGHGLYIHARINPTAGRITANVIGVHSDAHAWYTPLLHSIALA